MAAIFSHPRDASLAAAVGAGSPRSNTGHVRGVPGDSLNTPLNMEELQLMFQLVGGRPMPHDVKAWAPVAAQFYELVCEERKKPNKPNVSMWAGLGLFF